jgi:hypothetical protein
MRATILTFLALLILTISTTGFWPEVSGTIFPNTIWGLYSRDFFENVLVEVHGGILDLLVVGVVLYWFQIRHDKAEMIKRHKRTIADLRYYRGHDASYRIHGEIKRLLELGIKSFPLSQANLNDLTIHDLHVESSDLQAINFKDSRLSETSFTDCKMEAAIFAGTALSNVSFLRVDLRRAKFQAAKLNGCDFRSCNICVADFTNAALRSADFRGVDCKSVDFTNADLRSANFIGAKNLTQAMLDVASDIRYIKK